VSRFTIAVADIRFQLDEHIDPAVAMQLRLRGIDVLTADEAGLRHAPDTRYFQHSRETTRVIVTYDRHFAGMHHQGFEHSGIVFFPKVAGVSERSSKRLHWCMEFSGRKRWSVTSNSSKGRC
jgi:hypothetical protein